jgi:long-chain acyl-CoA synthetase
MRMKEKERVQLENTKPFYLKKLFKVLFAYNKFNTSNWIDILSGIYGDRKIFFLEKELDYGFFRGSSFTYKDMLKFINRMGNAFKELGVKKGDRIALITMNRLELAFAYFAGMKIGAVVVPLNAMYKPHEIKYVVENAEADVLVTDRQVFNASIVDTKMFPSIKKWIMLTREEVPEGFYSLSELMLNASEKLDPIEKSPDDIVSILYTSGTTGYPKGAILHEEAVARTIKRMALFGGMFPTINRFLGLYVVPLAHVMGYVIMIAMCSMGLPCIFMSRFEPETALQIMEKYGVRVFIGVPAMYAMLSMAGAKNYDLSKMKVWGSAADALPREYLEEFRGYGGIRLFGKQIIPPLFFEGYGQVETTGITAIYVHPFFFRKWREKPHGCVGKPRRDMEVKIVDENWNEVKVGEPGELIVRGPRVIKAYWKADELNRIAFKDGWFRTGDIMRMDKKGRLYFVDREKDMIKVGGYSVFSKEVEEEMMANPNIAEVAVIGVKDKIKGQKPIAVVRLKPGAKTTEEELLQWAKEHIAAYKAPRKVIIVEEMPYGATMKIDKKALRKQYENIFLE